MGALHEDQYTYLLRMRNVSEKSFIEGQKTQFVFNKFFSSENRAF